MCDSEAADSADSDGDSKPSEVLVVPTSHASEASSETIQQVVAAEEPDAVALELDQARAERLVGDGPTPDASLRTLVRQRDTIGLKGVALLALIGRAQSTIADKLGIDVTGVDMLAGHEAAQAADIPVALVDRDIQETVQRFADEVTVRELLRMGWQFTAGLVHLHRTSDEALEEQVQTENIDIELVHEELGRAFPTFKTVFIDERDAVIADRTSALANAFDRTVLVIGAGHEPGVTERLRDTDGIDVRVLDGGEHKRDADTTN